MTRDKIEILWQQAMTQAVKDGEMFTRYHFAKLVAAAEREQCALAAWEIVQYEVHADLADQVAQAIRARGQASETRMCPSTYYECQRGCGDGGCKDFEDAHQRSQS